jgi:hypothetical protein
VPHFPDWQAMNQTDSAQMKSRDALSRAEFAGNVDESKMK